MASPRKFRSSGRGQKLPERRARAYGNRPSRRATRRRGQDCVVPSVVVMRRARPARGHRTSSVARPSKRPMLATSVVVVRKMLDAVAGSAPSF